MPVMEAEAKEGAAEAASFYGVEKPISNPRGYTKLSETEWRQLMARSLKGEGDKELSTQFGINPGTLRQKRYNDPVWRIAHERVSELLAVKIAPPAPIVKVQPAALSIREIAETHPQLVANFAHGKIVEAIEGGYVPSIQSWSDFKTAMEIIRKSCNLDSNTTNVQVNLWSGSPASQAPSVVMDAEIVPDKCSDEEWI